ncbi:MAG: quinohemoprotein amine dehydrogenase subunit alpha [Candidatus Competibacteraceae bacterium]|nr:quinohemoprotein amine dehydrogenase subunit alpha [Candidatus Competibacteraceae bacterium]
MKSDDGFIRLIKCFVLSGALMLVQPVSAEQLDQQLLLTQSCVGCHMPNDQGQLSRISAMRKTPEGWDMTIVRMGIWHGMNFDTAVRRQLVKYLADTQGLAPEETADYRGLLERRPNMPTDYADEDIGVICARCHSYGRIALQRRDEDEWRKLSHTHLGQWPTIEYQATSRDRNWWEIARDQMPVKLAALYPLKTDAWTEWQSRKPADPAGEWRLSGEQPGAGRYTGHLKIKALGNDQFETEYQLTYADGKQLTGQGKAILYTGYEWRGAAKLGEESIRSVYALSSDGQRLSGRWFLKEADEIGGDLTAVRVKEGESAIVAVEPPFIRAGEKTTVTIYGYGLAGDVALGEGVKALNVSDRSPDQLSVEVEIAQDAQPGLTPISVGEATADALLKVYQKIDAVRVEPAFAIARIGGGTLEPVKAQLRAVGYLNGPDGQAGTEDDIRLGSLAADWAVDNFDETAAAMKDAQYAGQIADTGLFTPSPGGPNPKRQFSANNVGNLKVTATVKDGDRSLAGDGQLIVTVQRWNNPPLQ